jgi:hypothetical protein
LNPFNAHTVVIRYTSRHGLDQRDADAAREEDEARSDDLRLIRREISRIESALALAVSEELAATRVIEEMMSKRAPKVAAAPQWLPGTRTLFLFNAYSLCVRFFQIFVLLRF